MDWLNYKVFLILLLVITGSINSLSTKWADKLFSIGSLGIKHKFEHPFLQACIMFLGELTCLLAFKVLYWIYSRRGDGSETREKATAGNLNFSATILLPAALFDMVATATMYVGLNLTYVSSFQMFRGSVIVFVALLSMAFLRRKHIAVEWIGISLVMCGLLIVGVSDFTSGSTADSPKDTNSIITGDLLIIAAQIITAFQMVYEEKFVKDKDIPALLAVGYEGVFGFIVLFSLLVPFYWIPAYPPFSDNPHNRLEDLPDGLLQLYNNPLLMIATLGNFASISFFNFAGLSLTKELSATTRMVLDSVRTIIVWAVSLALGWQIFSYLQVIGFILMVMGMCLYNRIILEPAFRSFVGYLNRRAGASHSRLVEEESGTVDNHRADQAADA